MKKVLGLDIGTNSIGAALIQIPGNIDDFGMNGKIEWLGSRIIPTDGDDLQKFESGAPVETGAAARRSKRGSRRLKHRYKLRRTRLIQVLKKLGWLAEDFPDDFKKKMNDNPEFKFNIGNYLPLSDQAITEAAKLLGVENKKGELAVSEDWIIYYLRKKALTEKITLSEFVRILYMMNQRRGFKSGRKDLKDVDEKAVEIKWVEQLMIVSVEENKEKPSDQKRIFIVKAKGEKEYEWTVKRREKPQWEGKEFRFLLTVRNGKLLTPQIPKDDDWELAMVSLDSEFERTGKQPGEFFFDKLHENKNYKIRQQVVKRRRYQDELNAIWKKQEEFHPELRDKSKLHLIAETLYPTQSKNNGPKLKEILSGDLLHVIANDIIYYQRDLKSQKNSVGRCRCEKITFEKDGEKILKGIPAAPKSAPEFQEFRIWQDVLNIRVMQRERNRNGKIEINADVSHSFLTNEVNEKLFELFDSSSSVIESDIFKLLNQNLPKSEKLSSETHYINLFAAREKLQGNETKDFFRKVFRKHEYETEGEKILSDKKKFYKLWHILYSISSADVEKSAKGIHAALTNEKNGFNFPSEIIEHFKKLPPLPQQYASYSSKAIKKLLPFVRCGKYWNESAVIDPMKKFFEWKESSSFTRLSEKIQRELSIIEAVNDFQALPVWKACYVVYGKFSERESDEKYSSAKQIDVMKLVSNNCMRNPIVEQVVRETLNLVKDVWEKLIPEGEQIDEIHIELARDLKKNAEERKRLTEMNTSNREEKEHIKRLLTELLNGSFQFSVAPNPDSPIDIEKFRLWKNSYLPKENEDINVQNEKMQALFKGEKGKQRVPTNAEVSKYILWLNQGCISPYTGKVISLSQLFDETLYEKEHIIPRSKLKYDSQENLVICESPINKAKGNLLAMEFITAKNGSCTHEGKTYSLLKPDEYVMHCKNVFQRQRSKLRNLLRTDVPDDFVTRQLNDTRYITRKIAELLYPIAKDKAGIVFTSGSITSELKENWGLQKVWKNLLLPRFKRLESITGRSYVQIDADDASKFHFHVEENPELDTKRIDHRHHALDALVIAATTREHIRYLNSLNAVDSSEELKKVKRALVKGKIREFALPWNSFTQDAKTKLSEMIVSFKASNKIITKPKNKYLKWVEVEKGKWKKELVSQNPNRKWMAVRKSMFKEPQGIIHLKEIKEVSLSKAIEVQINRMRMQDSPAVKTASYVYDKEARTLIKDLIERAGISIQDSDVLMEEIIMALRKNPLKNSNGEPINQVRIAEFVEYASKRGSLNKTFTQKKIEKNIPYAEKSPIAVLLRHHLKEYNGKPQEAFEGEGLEKLNEKAIADKKIGKPISRLRRYESKDPDDKFKNKFVEVDAGSNFMFVMYEDNEGNRSTRNMYTISVHKAIERITNNQPLLETREGMAALSISPNQLVYVPTDEELKKIRRGDENAIDWSDKKKIFERTYKMIKCTGNQCYFIPHFISKLILPYDSESKLGEIETQNCSEKTFDGTQVIKQCCIKLSVDRLGNVKPA